VHLNKLTRKTVNWVNQFVHHWWYIPLVAFLSFLDAYVFIIPNEAVLVAAVLAHRKRWFASTFWTTFGSAVGAGLFAWMAELWGERFINYLMPMALHSKPWDETVAFLNQHGVWGLTLVSLSPFPQHLAVAVMGLAHFSPLHVFFAVMLGRFPKYLFFGWAAAYAPHWLKRLGVHLPELDAESASEDQSSGVQ